MALFGISSDRIRKLRREMHQLGLYEKDIRENFVRSSGPGGQNVNKVATCVVLRHLPTGIVIKFQQERSQGLNRFKARYRLVQKVISIRTAARKKAAHDSEQNKRRNRKRTKAQKERILEEKKFQSRRKKSRQSIRADQIQDYD